MAKRKAKGRPAAKPQPKTVVKNGPNSSRMVALGVIAVSLIVLIVYAAMGMADKPATPTDTAANTAGQLAPPMSGTEVRNVGAIDVSKAKIATFKLEELSGTDCFDSVVVQFGVIGGIGQVRANYDNALCEVQYDPSKIDEAKIIEALGKSEHPGKVTSEKIPANAAPQPSVETTQK